MNNSTNEFHSQLDNAVLISYTIWHTCGFICVLFGVPGHLFHLLITLNESNRKEATSWYFTAIAICELIYLCGLYQSSSISMCFFL